MSCAVLGILSSEKGHPIKDEYQKKEDRIFRIMFRSGRRVQSAYRHEVVCKEYRIAPT